MAQLSDNPALAQALLTLVRARQFELTPDSMCQGQPVRNFPSLDLAVVVFPSAGAPVFANVLFSRDFPEGHIAQISPKAEQVSNIVYLKDQTNARYESIAWLPGSDWRQLHWETLTDTVQHSPPGNSFVAPYPASLLKLMVLVGVARLVDAGKVDWRSERTLAGTKKSVAEWADSMIVASNNDATTVLVRLLHEEKLIVRSGPAETNHLNQLFAQYGLHTLQLGNTQPDGGWRSADGAGVGHHHMTAWDSVRLLWLLADEEAPWLPAGTPALVSNESRQRIWEWLGDQGLHTVLSSTSLAGVPGWTSGIPATLSPRWIQDDGSVQVEAIRFPADVRSINQTATRHFAHKTGNTENYCSDAGLVTTTRADQPRYIIALLSNLGSRYQAGPDCSTTWRIPALGYSIDRWIASHFN